MFQDRVYKQLNRSFSELVYDARLTTRTHRSGKTFFVDSNTGSDAASNSGTRYSSPMASIAAAMAKCTASQGDKIICLSQHAETVTSSITVKAGVLVAGQVEANRRPVITVNGAIDLFNMSGAAAHIHGLDLAIITTDAATAFINAAAAKCSITDVKMIPSSGTENVVDCITIAAGADDLLIDNVSIFNTTVAVNSFVSIEAAVARLILQNSYMFGDVATAGIIDGATATQIIIRNNMIKTIGTNIPACILDSNPTGAAYRNHMYGTDATIANDAQWGSALLVGENYIRGGTGSTVSATSIIPALDT